MIVRSLITEESMGKSTQCCDNSMDLLIWIPSHYVFLHCVHHWMAEDSASSLKKRLDKLNKALISSASLCPVSKTAMTNKLQTVRPQSPEMSAWHFHKY